MRHQQGFTLVEVLVAMALFAVVMFITTGPLITSLRMSGSSQNNLETSSGAQSKLERAREIVELNYTNPNEFNFSAAGLTDVTCVNLDVFGNPRTDASAPCNQIANPPARRLSAEEQRNGKPITLSLDVAQRL